MVRVLTARDNGMDSPVVIRMKAENTLRQPDVSNIESASCSVEETKGLVAGYDIVAASNHLTHELDGHTDDKLTGLDSLADDNEIRIKLEAALR